MSTYTIEVKMNIHPDYWYIRFHIVGGKRERSCLSNKGERNDQYMRMDTQLAL